MALFIEVQYRGDWWGEDPMTETRYDTPGDLFRALSGKGQYSWEALGRCTGKVYVDDSIGVSRHVGWVFQARNPEPTNRSDVQPTGLREAWVTVHTSPPTVVRTPHYASL